MFSKDTLMPYNFLVFLDSVRKLVFCPGVSFESVQILQRNHIFFLEMAKPLAITWLSNANHNKVSSSNLPIWTCFCEAYLYIIVWLAPDSVDPQLQTFSKKLFSACYGDRASKRTRIQIPSTHLKSLVSNVCNSSLGRGMSVGWGE